MPAVPPNLDPTKTEVKQKQDKPKGQDKSIGFAKPVEIVSFSREASVLRRGEDKEKQLVVRPNTWQI